VLLLVPGLTIPLEIFLSMACPYRENRTLRSSWLRKTCKTATARHEHNDDVCVLEAVRDVGMIETDGRW